MKRIFFIVILIIVAVTGFSQNIDDWNWGGLVMFKPGTTISDAILADWAGFKRSNYGEYKAGFDIAVDWVPYVAPNVGIPVEFEVLVSVDGIRGFAIIAGISAVPLRHKEKSGLYLTVLGGPFFIAYTYTFAVKAYAGYQLVTDGGFVLTPAIGAKYNGISGVSLDLMFDVGFAYRKK
ncbi:MAG: hypothetical protein LBV17_01120 [Treponema sp.]|jgi:hypothetical protein|nr:hypothetical protein [Treponema sp.]